MNGDEYRYIHGRSTAGFIYTHGGEHRFFHTSDATEEPNRSMVFPPHCIACASEMGLVLFCRLPNAAAGADGNANTLYLVSNPSFTETETDIPNPPRPHYSPMPRVLVAGWDATRLCLVFHIVCAVQVDNTSYSFDVYSSNTDKWESTGRREGNLGLQIRENTGIACGTRAYWLLDSSVPIVAYYDVRGGKIGTIDPPKECLLYIASPAQLGRWGCELCMVVIWDQLKRVRIFTLGGHGRWLSYHDLPYFARQLPPMLSRFQSAKLQVPFWCKNVMVFLENGWRGRRNFRQHAWPKLDSPETDCIGYVLPHVATNWLPLLHFPIAP